jgi:RHS repeat-associated protein
MITDYNKGISPITYNHLNLPQQVHIKSKGNIIYTYDAGGNKLAKLTMDSLSKHATTTLYMNGFVYQQGDTIITPNAGIDTLQFVGHEEGRARWAFHRYVNGTTGYKWEYDFFEKDHLGNTREVLTQQRDTAQYMATMEAAYRATENKLFYNVPQSNVWSYYVNGSSGPNPFGTAITNPNDSVCRINGNTPHEGPAIILKVMAGDIYRVGVNSFWKSGQTSTGTTDATTDVLSSLANGIISMVGGAKGDYGTLSNSSTSPLLGGVNAFRNDKNPTPPTNPKAYLNYIALDNQFNYDQSASGALGVGGADILASLATDTIRIKKNGYLYIYLLNETKSVSVFFDNLSVTHYSGPLLEETHYYPFGLTMAGISDKALKTNYAQNKFRYNEKELQSQEFSDGTGLEEYDFGARFQDPQLGLWHNVDPKVDQSRRFSPYTYAFDNPTRFIDPDGMEADDWRNKDGKLIYDPKANDGKGGYTEFATNNDKKIGNELQRTEKGKEQFNKLVNSEQPTEIVLSPDKHLDKEGKPDDMAGETDNGREINYTTDEKDNIVDVTIKKSTITVYVGQVDEMLADDKKGEPHGLYNKSVAGFSFLEIIGAVIGHEIEHTTKSNTITKIKGGNYEAEATKVSDAIIDQVNQQKKEK